MKESGCVYIGMGVESGSDRTLTKIKKGYTRAQAIKGVNLTKESGISVAMNIIIGFPFETAKDIHESISLIEELDVPTNVNTFTPYPGSEIFNECVRLGLIKDEIDWSRISQHSPYNAFVSEMSEDTYRVFLDYMVLIADNAGAISEVILKKILEAGNDDMFKRMIYLADDATLKRMAYLADDATLKRIAYVADDATLDRMTSYFIDSTKLAKIVKRKFRNIVKGGLYHP
jgi:radical SAM superfamily enzyme YgiQ (UPF0313 family)